MHKHTASLLSAPPGRDCLPCEELQITARRAAVLHAHPCMGTWPAPRADLDDRRGRRQSSLTPMSVHGALAEICARITWRRISWRQPRAPPSLIHTRPITRRLFEIELPGRVRLP